MWRGKLGLNGIPWRVRSGSGANAPPGRALQDLQGALQELFECDRVLSSLLMQGEPAGSD